METDMDMDRVYPENLRVSDSPRRRYRYRYDSFLNLTKLGLFVFRVTVPKREPRLQDEDDEDVPNSLSQSPTHIALRV